ncbi:MAG: hypothetical protein ABIX10_07390 [Acidimicrobiales bacterium]
MDLSVWAEGALTSRALWTSLASASVAAMGAVLVGLRWALPRDRVPGLVLAAGAVGSVSSGGWALVAVVLVVSQLGSRPGSVRSLAAPVISVGAVGALYACVPDTEHALVVVGGLVAAVGVALGLQAPWGPTGRAVTASLVLVTWTDGSTRPSALIAGAGIAVVHAVAPSVRPGVSTIVIAVAGMLVLSRGVGLLDGLRVPLVLGISGTALLVLAILVSGRSPAQEQSSAPTG